MAQKSNEWHLRDPDAVLSMLDTDKFNGLTPKQVQKRRYRDGKNKVWHVRHSSATEYAMKSLGDLTSVLLVIAALTAAVFEKSTIAESANTPNNHQFTAALVSPTAILLSQKYALYK